MGGRAVSPAKRKLRWRVLMGSHWLDLVEERRDGEPVSYVGMVDGREALRSGERNAAATSLVRHATKMPQ